MASGLADGAAYGVKSGVPGSPLIGVRRELTGGIFQSYIPLMRFEWDAAKNNKNIDLRQIDFADCAAIAVGRLIVWEEERDFGEDRWNGLGKLHGRVMAFTMTWRNGAWRWISVRKGSKREIERYETTFVEK